MRHIYLVGGGTAGHISPLATIADELRHQLDHSPESVEIVYVGLIGGVHQPDPSHFDRIVHIRGGKFRRYANTSALRQVFDLSTQRQNIRDIGRIIGGYRDSQTELRRSIAPGDSAVIFTKGGYVGVPFVLAAAQAGWPVITHDSDMVPGLANRLLQRCKPRRLIGWGSVAGAETVGIPVHPRFNRAKSAREAIRRELGLGDQDRMVVIIGGSQGARRLDTAVQSALENILPKMPDLRVHHVFGKLNEAARNDAYKDLHSPERARITLHTFRPDIERYLAAADLVISRAGATALAEAAVIGCPLILVPGEQLTGSQQVVNAEFAAAQGAALAVRETPMDTLPQRLAEAMEDLLQHPDKAHTMAHQLSKLAHPDAAERIARIILTIGHE